MIGSGLGEGAPGCRLQKGQPAATLTKKFAFFSVLLFFNEKRKFTTYQKLRVMHFWTFIFPKHQI